MRRAIWLTFSTLLVLASASTALAAPPSRSATATPTAVEQRARFAREVRATAKWISDLTEYAHAVDVAQGRAIECPVPGSTFTDTWHAPRDGHLHQGVDMMAPEGTVIVAPAPGYYRQHGNDSFYLDATSGTQFFGTHLQRHLRGDGSVQAGDPIALVGHTGNASVDAPHLHFEIHPGGGDAVDPYPATAAGCSVGSGAGTMNQEAALRPSSGGSAPIGGGCYARFDSWRWLDCVHRGHGHRHSQAQLQREWRQLLRFLSGVGSGGGGGGGGSLVWHWQLVANCESTDNIWAVGGGGAFRGWLQFTVSTWHAYGGQGDPLGQPREVQAAVAERVRAGGQGLGAWPHCGAYYR